MEQKNLIVLFLKTLLNTDGVKANLPWIQKLKFQGPSLAILESNENGSVKFIKELRSISIL